MAESLESLVEKFCAITATDEDTAQRYLELADGNVQSAIDLFLVSNDDPEAVQSPPPSNQAEPIGVDFAGGQPTSSQTPLDGLDAAYVHDFVTAARESFQTDAMHEFGMDLENASGALSALYRPPDDITHKGRWESARDEAKLKNRWLLINVQDPSEFACHELNRDIWSNVAVRELVTNNFVLLQMTKGSMDGRRLSNYYGIQSYPYIAIIDPRTGQMMSRVDCKDAIVFCDKVATFLESHPTPNGTESDGFDPDVIYIGSTNKHDAQTNGVDQPSADGVRKRPSGDSASAVSSTKQHKKDVGVDEIDMYKLADNEFQKYLKSDDEASSSCDTPLTLVLRLSDGTRNVCRISSSARVKDIYNYLENVLHRRVWDYDLALNYPRRLVSLREHALLRLSDLNFHQQEVVDLEKRHREQQQQPEQQQQ